MSGVGFSAAGNSPAGYGEAESTTAAQPNLIAARYINPQTRDFEVDDDGRYLSMSPLKQRIYLMLATNYGSAIGLPKFGSKITQIKVLNDRTPGAVQSAVRDALKQLTDVEKLIRIDRIDVEYRDGVIFFRLLYIDLINNQIDILESA